MCTTAVPDRLPTAPPERLAMKERMTRGERRARRADLRAQVAQLRASVREGLALKKRRMRDLTVLIRAERVALRDRLRIARKTRLVEIRAWERNERATARADWKRRREEAKRDADSELARARGELEAERAHAREVRRITTEARAKVALHAKGIQTDDDVRSLVPTALLPFFERVRTSLRATANASRAEAFLKLAAARPDEVFAIVEPQMEETLQKTLALIGEIRKVDAAYARLSTAPANGNRLTSGGPAPTEVARVRALDERPAKAAKGEGLDTTEIAKRIREEIKAAVKSKELPKGKYSVRSDKYSMGASITVEASRLPFRVINPDAYRVDRGANWATFDSVHHRSRFTAQAQEVERKLSAIVDGYHWDRSDSMTDYYNERFAKDVRLTEDKDEWKKIEAAKVAAARAAEGRGAP
jgi:hypothetical protein